MDLYEQEKRVAEYYATIGRVIRSTWRIRGTGELLKTFAEQIGLHFGWTVNLESVRAKTQIFPVLGSGLYDNSYKEGELCPIFIDFV